MYFLCLLLYLIMTNSFWEKKIWVWLPIKLWEKLIQITWKYFLEIYIFIILIFATFLLTMLWCFLYYRAVSKYLQTLFDKESQHGRRVLAMDNLLMGKTRKEASRMFFETLVCFLALKVFRVLRNSEIESCGILKLVILLQNFVDGG